jgi:hypothetical protein
MLAMLFVIPAKAGIQTQSQSLWTPAFAGGDGGGILSTHFCGAVLGFPGCKPATRNQKLETPKRRYYGNLRQIRKVEHS